MMTSSSYTPSPSRFIAHLSLGFMGLCLLVYVLMVGRAILIPLVIAIFVWYLINASVRGLELVKIGGKSIPSRLRYTFVIVAFLASLGLVGTVISSNIIHVLEAAPEYQRNFQPIIDRITGLLHMDHQPTMSDLKQYLDLGGLITSVATVFTGLAGKTIVVLLYTGFMLYEQQYFRHKFSVMIENQKTEDHIRMILQKIDTRIQRYIGIKALNGVIDAFMTYILLLIIGVDFAEFWGMLAFFLHFIPYVGSVTAICVPSLIALVQFGDPMIMLLVGCGIGAIHSFIGHFLEPYMLGFNLNLSPIFIVTTLALWGLIWGVPGMFLAVPILAIVTIVLSQFPRTRPFAVLLSKTGDLKENLSHEPALN